MTFVLHGRGDIHRVRRATGLVFVQESFIVLTDELELMKIGSLANIKTILSIVELDHTAIGTTHSKIVMNTQTLQLFDQTTLKVTRVCSLDSRINETFTTSHTMKVVLLWPNTTEETIPDEATCTRRRIVGIERGQSATGWHARNTLALELLLTEQTGDLRKVHDTTFGAAHSHQTEVVQRKELALAVGQTGANDTTRGLVHATLHHAVEHLGLTFAGQQAILHARRDAGDLFGAELVLGALVLVAGGERTRHLSADARGTIDQCGALLFGLRRQQQIVHATGEAAELQIAGEETTE
mmetsp:Transcript_25032/g.62872  ORF Transcript_25032/g.62872 Transcript_25032/m.62872 type:complete len:297 (+) Transcript_25032:2655-3545(+)